MPTVTIVTASAHVTSRLNEHDHATKIKQFEALLDTQSLPIYSQYLLLGQPNDTRTSTRYGSVTTCFGLSVSLPFQSHLEEAPKMDP